MENRQSSHFAANYLLRREMQVPECGEQLTLNPNDFVAVQNPFV